MTTLTIAALGAFGSEYLAWLPETTHREIAETFGVNLRSGQFSKLMAGVMILTTDRFWSNVVDWQNLTNALNGAGYDPGGWDPVDCVEAAWGLTEALFLERFALEPDRAEAGHERMDPEIRRYIAHAVAEEGLLDPPDVLRVAAAGRPGRGMLADWADDHATHAAVAEATSARSVAITTEVRARLRLLLDQVGRLLGMTVPQVLEHFQMRAS